MKLLKILLPPLIVFLVSKDATATNKFYNDTSVITKQNSFADEK
jgi:hypothetical protein